MDAAPTAGDIDRIEKALGWRPTTFRSATPGRGISDVAARWIVADFLGSGGTRRSAFVKIGATALTADWTRIEHQNYSTIQGSFLPDVLGFSDDGVRPVLALEDLSSADWPPPWTDDRVAAVLDALSTIHQTSPPGHLSRKQPDGVLGWQAVAAEPQPFLALDLCSPDWLRHALPALIAASAEAPIAGDSLIHLDIRSDNLCFRDDRALVIDWNHATVANSDLDVAFWLPSLHSEGGPPPESVLANVPELAAWVAGFFCARAGGDPIPEAPHVRPLQVEQARTALPWAARSLGLPSTA